MAKEKDKRYTGPAVALEDGVRVESAKLGDPVPVASDHRGKLIKPEGLIQPQKSGD